jgi:hypothetical protein
MYTPDGRPCRADHALRIQDRGQDEPEASNQKGVLTTDAEQLVEGREPEASGDEQAADDGATDARDATENGERQDRQRRESSARPTRSDSPRAHQGVRR